MQLSKRMPDRSTYGGVNEIIGANVAVLYSGDFADKKIQWLGKYQPLAIRNDGSILVIHNRFFYLFNKGKKREVGRINHYRFLSRIGLVRRLLRVDIRCAYLENDDTYLFFLDKVLYELKISKGEIIRLFTLPDNQSTPLRLQKGFDVYRVIWGEYCSNKDKHDVSIYGLTHTGKVCLVWTYKNKRIRHIHNIISDEDTGYFVFTGDNETEAGIYHHDPSFIDMTPVFTGEQNARAVIGFSTKGGLLYATDSVNNENHIFLMKRDRHGRAIIDEIGKINGSVIYGTECADGWLFSTTVESPEAEKGNIVDMLSTKRGNGILSDRVDLVHVDYDMNVSTLLSFTKDKLPYKLFQYGCVMFPLGLEKVHEIYFYPVAVRGFDGRMGLIKTNEYSSINQ